MLVALTNNKRAALLQTDKKKRPSFTVLRMPFDIMAASHVIVGLRSDSAARTPGDLPSVAVIRADNTQQQKLSEAFFEALTAASNYGANFANRALVACP
jgi:hypothetical protein